MTSSIPHKNALYQKLPFTPGNSFVVNRYTSPYFETPWHFHEAFELVFCETGFGNKFIGNSFSPYQQGDMALIGKNVPHLFKADDSFYLPDTTAKPSSLVIQFHEDFLGASFFNCPEMSEMKQVLTLSMNGLMIVGDTREKISAIMHTMPEQHKAGRLSSLIAIFGLLASSNDLQPILASSISGIDVNDGIKMQKVLEYALENFRDDISISEAARLTKLSGSAFCRYFKSRTQKSFLAFVIEMRLNEACRLLRETDLPVIDICYESGFKNLSNFNRLFRKQFQQRPVHYRAHKAAAILADGVTAV